MRIQVSRRHLAALTASVDAVEWHRDERLWTFLVASLIADAPERYVRLFCGEQCSFPPNGKVACEAEPLSTRMREGNTVLDIAFGHLALRSGGSGRLTEAGIAYSPAPDSWVCFVEGKYLSDCDSKVTNDPLRNQLTRVIENLLCFQANGAHPQRLYFTLLTPKVFRDFPTARLYGYKMREYQDEGAIIADIARCAFTKRAGSGYSYPNITERLAALAPLTWVTFEEVLSIAGLGQNLDVLLRPTELEHVRSDIKRRLSPIPL